MLKCHWFSLLFDITWVTVALGDRSLGKIWKYSEKPGRKEKAKSARKTNKETKNKWGFHFCLHKDIFWFFYFYFDPLIVSKCVISFPYICEFFRFPPVTDSLFHSILLKKDTWYNFRFLKFPETHFVTHHMIYPGICSMCAWEEHSSSAVEQSIVHMSLRSIWF